MKYWKYKYSKNEVANFEISFDFFLNLNPKVEKNNSLEKLKKYTSLKNRKIIRYNKKFRRLERNWDKVIALK